jgi:hypothetical protein
MFNPYCMYTCGNLILIVCIHAVILSQFMINLILGIHNKLVEELVSKFYEEKITIAKGGKYINKYNKYKQKITQYGKI